MATRPTTEPPLYDPGLAYLLYLNLWIECGTAGHNNWTYAYVFWVRQQLTINHHRESAD